MTYPINTSSVGIHSYVQKYYNGTVFNQGQYSVTGSSLYLDKRLSVRDGRNGLIDGNGTVKWKFPTAYFVKLSYLRNDLNSEKVFDYGYISREYGCLDDLVPSNRDADLHRVFPYDLINAAEIKALLKLKDQKVNLGVAFGERRETAQLLGDTAFRLARSLLALRRGDWRTLARELGIDPRYVKRSLRRIPRNVPRKWLEFKFGWQPLLSDLYGAFDKLTTTPSSDWIVTVKASVKRSSYLDEDNNTLYQETPVRWQAESIKGAFVRLDFIPDVDYMRQLNSLGVTNPISVLWELTPLSFLFDYLVPFGDYLNSLDATSGFRFLSGSVSTRNETTCNTSSIPSRKPYVKVWRFSRFERKFELNRSPYVTCPVPLPPGPKDSASLTHVANAMALLSVAVSSGGKGKPFRR